MSWQLIINLEQLNEASLLDIKTFKWYMDDIAKTQTITHWRNLEKHQILFIGDGEPPVIELAKLSLPEGTLELTSNEH